MVRSLLLLACALSAEGLSPTRSSTRIVTSTNRLTPQPTLGAASQQTESSLVAARASAPAESNLKG